jgi:hypothetical protein
MGTMGAMKGENDLNVSVQAGQHFTTFKCYSVVNLYAYFFIFQMGTMGEMDKY